MQPNKSAYSKCSIRMASRWALCIAVAVVAAVCVGGVDSFSLPEKVATLSSPNPVRGARTELDNWLVSLRVLRHLSPNSPHLADVDVNDVKSVTVRGGGWPTRL